METYKLNLQMQNTIEKNTGIKFSEIEKMDWQDINNSIEKKIGKKLTYSKRNLKFLGRGSMYIALERLFSMKSIYRKIEKI